MKPPIFSIGPTGDTAQQYLHRARMFRDAAMQLSDYSNGEQYWPKYALISKAEGLEGTRLKARLLDSAAASEISQWN